MTDAFTALAAAAGRPASRRRFCLLPLALAGGAVPWSAGAQNVADWPARPVKIVVPFAAGGGSDLIARFVASRLAGPLGQSFVVDNKPGAGGNLGTEQGLKAVPDGYTLTLIASSYSVNAAVYKLGFDPVKDVTPIVQISGGPLLIVSGPQTSIRTVADLIQEAKKKPGGINYATSGPGSISHVAAELFALQAGVKLTHVAYKGTAPALTDTMAGVVDLNFSSVASALPQIKAGKLRAVAVTTTTRLKALPEVPTIAEAGLPNYEVPHWHALVGPRGLPAPIVARINQAVNDILKQPDSDEHLERDGVSAVGGTPAQLGERMAREMDRWKKLVAAGNFKLD